MLLARHRLSGLIGLVLLAAGLPAATASADSYRRCPDRIGVEVDVARSSCAAAAPAAAAAAAAPPGEAVAVVAAEGWTPYRAVPADPTTFYLVALRGPQVLRLRLEGATPDLDGFAAGRELLFARKTIVGGKPIPKGASLCTSGFLVRLPTGSLAGLSASHCAGLRRDGTAERRNAAVRRAPAPGIVLGRVTQLLERSTPLDALVVPTPQSAGRTATPVVDRGVGRPPWVVSGIARSTGGRRVCFTGRTSGADRCGTLRGTPALPLERSVARVDGLTVRCTTVSAAEGDSGGPVYSAPRADGTVSALGITTLVVGPQRRMCFTPLMPVLEELGAQLVVSA